MVNGLHLYSTVPQFKGLKALDSKEPITHSHSCPPTSVGRHWGKLSEVFCPLQVMLWNKASKRKCC